MANKMEVAACKQNASMNEYASMYICLYVYIYIVHIYIYIYMCYIAFRAQGLGMMEWKRLDKDYHRDP